MRYELKSIGLWAFTKVAFFVNMILGFLFGMMYAFFFGFIMAVMQNMPYLPDEGMAPPSDVPFGFLVIILPFIFAIIGGFIYTVLGIIFVVIYNLIVKITGGLEFNLNSIVELAPVPSPIYAQSQMQPGPMPPPPPAAEYQPKPPSSPPPPRDPRDDEFPTRTVGG